MTTWMRADEAVRLLGISKPSLYAYVSRGLIERHAAVDGRTSLYARADVERLAARTRSRAPAERPTIDVQVASAVTELHDAGLVYRGHAVDALAGSVSFERVAELLWSGVLPDHEPAWRVDRVALDRVTRALSAGRVSGPLARLAIAAAVLADGEPGDDPPAAGRRLLALAPSVLGGPLTGTIAARLARAYTRRPAPELVDAFDRALVLLADHELATSTLAVRVAASVRANPSATLAVGLHTVGGALHGGAAAQVTALLHDAGRRGVGAALTEVPGPQRPRLAGFGHTIYRNADPRVAPLMAAVTALAAAAGAAAGARLATVEAVAAEGLHRLLRHPNIDFALGALYYLAELPADVPLFAVARIAGWAAHDAEERGERPVRYRGLARQPVTG